MQLISERVAIYTQFNERTTSHERAPRTHSTCPGIEADWTSLIQLCVGPNGPGSHGSTHLVGAAHDGHAEAAV
jgi:hypothetical protein